ncbi:MAG: hypothetical protein JXR10_12895 [Cyclobacteriaceae bacterium]
MKKLLTLLLIGSFTFFISCGEDEEPILPNANSTADAVAVVGTAITLMDEDTDATGFSWAANPSTGVEITANEASATVTFSAAGDYEIVVTRTYPKNFENETTTNTITVEVYDILAPVIEAVSVRNDGTDGPALTMESGASNPVSAGQVVRYINNSVGGVTGSTWTFEGGTPATASNVAIGGVVDVTYAEAGDYDVTVEVERSTAGVEDKQSVTYTDLVKAVTPMSLLSTTSFANESTSSLVFVFSKDIDAATVADATFTVNATNMGASASIAVSSVSVEGGDSVVVALSETLLASDSLLVDYSGLIADATDGALADNFTGQFVPNYKEITFGYGGLENTAIVDGTLVAGGWSGLSLYGASYGSTNIINDGKEFKVFSTWGDPAVTEVGTTTDECYDGMACARLKGALATDVSDLGVGYFGGDQRVNFEEGKTYFISVMVKVLGDGVWFKPEDRCAEQTEAACIVDASFDIFFVNYAGWGNVADWKLKDLGTDWMQLTTKFTSAEAVEGSYPFLRVFGNGEVILDNYYMVEVEAR